MSGDTWIVIGVIVAVIGIITLVIALRYAFKLFSVYRALRATGAKGQWVFWGALAYLVFPIDILPDPIYLDDVGVLAGALWFLTRLLRKQETLRGGLPHAQRLVQQADRHRNRRSQDPV
ncbi:MAG TPA: YkvA family protein [Micromonosporaceae bacterium]|jgi:uncharacterized membrane protein YkvA (DUF1232 family)